LRLEGKTAIITGAAQGLGKAIARRYALEGAQCIITDLNVPALSVATNELQSLYGDRIVPIVSDVADASDVQVVVAETMNRFGKIDVLCNNAAISFEKNVEDITLHEWNTLLSVNLTGPFLMIKEVFPIMKQQSKGSIINMSSELAFVGYERLSAYTAAKGAIIAFSRSVALEGVPYNIRVNCLCPGAADTPMFWAGETDPDVLKEMTDDVKKTKPGGRLVTPDEVAAGAVFLAADESSAVNGTHLIMDLGYTAR
jgi:NAD(P)-dependent dehydrogenase (short-subunit alcohol dehydrogenase family)